MRVGLSVSLLALVLAGCAAGPAGGVAVDMRKAVLVLDKTPT